MARECKACGTRKNTKSSRKQCIGKADASSCKFCTVGGTATIPFNVAPSALKAPINRFKPRALSERGVERTIKDFMHSAHLAKAAGYDGVEIMGSEGYLINQFLVSSTNHRKDRYGGSFENRMRFPVEIYGASENAWEMISSSCTG